MLKEETILNVRIIRLQELSQNIPSEIFDTTLEPGGEGEYNRKQLHSFILRELWIVEQAFRLEHPVKETKPKNANKQGLKKGRDSAKSAAPVLAFRTVWLNGKDDPKLVRMNEALRNVQLLDENGRWLGILEYLGALIRQLGENQFIPARRQIRYKVKDEILYRQRNGTFDHPTEGQLDNAYKRAGYGIPDDIQNILALLLKE